MKSNIMTFEKIMWAICIIPLVAGIIMLDCSTSKVEYSTSECWVAADYHHVYEKYSGEIVDYISENESCSIDGDTITVKTTNRGLSLTGGIITTIFGMFTIGAIWGSISNSYWWNDLKRKFEN